METKKKVEWERIPIIINFTEALRFAETYGYAGTQGTVWLEGQHFRPKDQPSDTVYIVMHPSSVLQLLPLPTALADAGLHVICASSRYARNDSALIMEKVCYDLGQYVRWAKATAGYKRVVLIGWSGGGALSLFYQGQAERPSITHTPAGDEYDLTSAKLIPADGVVFIAAHLSRAETLTEILDPSVKDEFNPDDRDLDLDIYDPACPHQPPYDAEFIARFRAAQLARSRKITDFAENTLAHLKAKDDGEMERAFVVHRTWCDLRWLDLSIHPNGRQPNITIMGPPKVANSAPAGLARYTSLRSWLSQWSIHRSNAKGADSASRITNAPVLQIENQADDSVPVTHNPIVHNALGTPDKEFVRIHGANHYYAGQPQQLRECVRTVIDWSQRRGFV
ncbi:alpha/beta hydrolase [Paraburkholderia sp. 1N]|uniref:Alpha/beta hydrolase n=1 Tax=Paraburkholderia solitsugae TaxID=2675748 RepID=A0ABX2C796_9BURK|nr:alpha/beta hydrolase [Paraburkholderia solitsugae]NPT47950.1 alpha/beta hydrolase [Paraburkholderia solitsugae]